MQEDSTDVGQLEMHDQAMGLEEEAPAEEQEQIVEPFDPEDIDVITRSMTVDLLLSRASSGMIDLQPDFQRRWGIWDNKRQSRLIESLLLRIPLPVLYAAEDDDERWEIVDGIQRLSTIARFINPQVLNEKKLILSDLEYLKDYEGKDFLGLSPRLQLRLKEAELIIHLIRKGTPPEVKFNIFARINTGGMTLSSQELRHAITPGKARGILEDWSKLPEFLSATDRSVRPNRMDDRELILRFLAFYILGVEKYRYADMDGFLIAAMQEINRLDQDEVDRIKEVFRKSMNVAKSIFGNDAFRKRYSESATRLPINKALFEALSTNIAHLSEATMQNLIRQKKQVQTSFMKLCSDRSFDTAISQGTGNVNKVKTRFGMIGDMLSGIVIHD